jgi:NADH-quinone oxidoreductase subunit H
VSLFLGGPLGPVPMDPVLASVAYTAYFLVKLLAVVLLIFVLRSAMARLRIAQASDFFWKILTPLALAQLAFVIMLGGM